MIQFDCRHYRGDRPCAPHKREGVVCATCPDYQAVKTNLLIIKLGAPGDVLRTTPVVGGLTRQYPDSQITWLTRKEALPLLEGVPGLHAVLPLEAESLAVLGAQHFNGIYNFDNDPVAGAIAAKFSADERKGFVTDRFGKIRAVDEAAQAWLELATNDNLKRANQQSYPWHLQRMAGVEELGPIKVCLSSTEQAWAKNWAANHHLKPGKAIGFNTGAGARWPTKRWPQDHFIQLGRLLAKKKRAPALLLGGPVEHEENRLLADMWPHLFVDGGLHPVRHFMAQVSLCQAVVTADTLALHIAVGLGVPTAALFGPTAAAEIDLQGHGVKLTPPNGCDCWYCPQCTRPTPCMAEITPEMVMRALEGLK